MAKEFYENEKSASTKKFQSVKKYVSGDPKSFIGNQLDGIRGTMGICESDYADGDFPHLAFAIDSLAGYSRNIIEACREIGDLGYYEGDLRYNVTDKSAKKSQSESKSFNDMVKEQRDKNKGIKKDISEIESIAQDIEEMKRKAKEVEEKMFAIDWNEYNMQAFPTKIADVYRALNTISDGLYIQFLM